MKIREFFLRVFTRERGNFGLGFKKKLGDEEEKETVLPA